MANNENAFMGARQVLLVGLGGVGGRIVNTIMRDLPANRRKYTQAIAIDTDISDMAELDYVPRDNKIVLAASPGSGKSMKIGQYLEKNPGASEWFVTEGAAFKTLMEQSTKNGAKQIRMVSRLALSATAKYFNFENRVTKIISKLSESDGSVNRDGLLVMIVCSVSGGTGAGTVLQVPMFLEDIITKYYDASEVSMQCAMLLPNLFNQTLANGNYRKGQVNGYAVMRELQSLNTGKLKRFEYMKDYAEVNGEDSRNKAPFSYVLLFDNATSSGATINGSTDNVHVPNIAKCLSEYMFGPAAHKCKSQLDNTLDTIYASGGTAIFRAVGGAKLVYPDNIYKQYAVSRWILRAVSEDWLHPGDVAHKNYLELRRKARDEGKKLPGDILKHTTFVNAVFDDNICKGTFYSEIRNQLVSSDGQRTRPLAEIFFDKTVSNALTALKSKKYGYSQSFSNLSEALKGKSKNTHDDSFNNLENEFLEFMKTNGNYIDSIMCPPNSLTTKFLSKDTNTSCLFTFVRMHKLHPIAFRTFLYQLEAKLENEERKALEAYTRDEVLSVVKNSSRKEVPNTVKLQMNLLAKPYEQRLTKDIASRMLIYVRELITEIEAFFDDLNKIKIKFESVSSSCFSNLSNVEDETTVLVGSPEGMVACWNDVAEKLSDGDTAEEEVIDNDLSEEINKMIYTAYFSWVSQADVSSSCEDVFRPKTKYSDIVSEHLLKNFYKRIDEHYSKSFPEDIIKAVIFESYVKKAYEEQSAVNPKFDLKKFRYSVEQSEYDYNNDGGDITLAADNLNKKLVCLVKKAEPLCGPLYTKSADEDYFARTLYFNKSILRSEVVADPNSESSFMEILDKSEFMPGVGTEAVDNFTINIEPVEGINKYVIGCFSYTGGLELHDFANMQDPVSGTFDSKDGRCYYNEYRRYLNMVMNTTKDNITPHLHKDWHLAGELNDITDAHTDSVNYHTAKAFVYGFLFNNVIRILDNGYVKIGIPNDDFFKELPGAVNGVLDYAPMTHTEHARFESSRNKVNRILFEIFQYLRNVPEVRTCIIKYGESLLEQAKASKKGSVFMYSIDDELCAGEVYETIIDVMDGFYQHARFSELHDGMQNDIKALGSMFSVLCDTVIDVCASIYPSSKERLERFTYFVEKLYKDAVCDEKADNAADSMDDMFTMGTIETEGSTVTKPFSKAGNFNKTAMISRMEAYLNKG